MTHNSDPHIELNQTEVELIAALADHSSPANADDGLIPVEAVFARIEKTILLADGDRNHGNQSALTCNDTMVALHLLRHLMQERTLIHAQQRGYTEAEGYAASLRQQANLMEKANAGKVSAYVVIDDFDVDKLRDAANFIERISAQQMRPPVAADQHSWKDAEIERLENQVQRLKQTQRRLFDGAQCVPWQPIETAPKDGSRILICREDRFPKNTYVARWLKDVWSIGPIGGEWHAYPTHWMPLPAGPSSSSPERGQP